MPDEPNQGGAGRRLRSAVVGCGGIAHEHLRFLRDSSRCELVAVCDRSAAAARLAAGDYGAGAAFTSNDELIASDLAVDVVHILTPPHTHEALAAAWIDRRAHVLCEKPITPTAATLEALIDRAEARGVSVAETRNYLWNDPVRRLRAAIAAGELGVVHEVDILMSMAAFDDVFGDPNLVPAPHFGGGALHDLLPHFAYVFLELAGHPVDRVVGRMWNQSGNELLGTDRMDALVFAGPVVGRLRFESQLVPDALRLVVRGTRGSVETDLFNDYERREGGRYAGAKVALERAVSGAGLIRAAGRTLRDKVLQRSVYHGIQNMLEEYYRHRSTSEAPWVDRGRALATARLVDGLVALRDPSGTGQGSGAGQGSGTGQPDRPDGDRPDGDRVGGSA